MRCSIISIHGLWLSPFTLGQWGVLPYSLYIYTVVLELCLWTCPLYETSLRWTAAWSMLDFFCNKLTPLYNQVRVNQDSFIIFASLLPDKPPHGFFVCLFFAPGMCFSVCVVSKVRFWKIVHVHSTKGAAEPLRLHTDSLGWVGVSSFCPDSRQLCLMFALLLAVIPAVLSVKAF